MSEVNILTKVQFQFSGLSHIQEATEENSCTTRIY